MVYEMGLNAPTGARRFLPGHTTGTPPVEKSLNAPTGARRFLPQRFRARADVWYVLMHLQVRGASCQAIQQTRHETH